ncbi:MAG: hypothetical protein MUE71_05630 [Chitinophagaceae bacterium]|nr:hypothetical protein [Chitinophagaceae bacterium]
MQKLTFDIVQDKELATYMKEVISTGGIDVTINESKPFYDTILGDIDSMLKYEVLLNPKDFEEAESLLYSALKKENADKEHWLNERTDDELLELVENPRSQGRLNSIIAEIILEKRNIKGVNNHLLTEEEPDDASFSAGESRSLPGWSKVLLVIASISGLFVLMLGMGGIIVGLFINRFKVHNAKGQLYFLFDKNTREFGLALTLISALIFIVTWFFISHPSFFY